MRVALEGIDGAGKTTQIPLLEEYFRTTGARLLTIYQPTAGPTGKLLRELLKEDQTYGPDPIKMALLFAADRMHMWHEIESHERYPNAVTIFDRCELSNIVYSNLDPNWFFFMEKYAPKPDLIILLDIDPEVAFERCGKTEGYEKLEFLMAARERYLLYQNHPRLTSTLRTIEVTNLSITEVNEAIIREVRMHKNISL